MLLRQGHGPDECRFRGKKKKKKIGVRSDFFEESQIALLSPHAVLVGAQVLLLKATLLGFFGYRRQW